MSKTPLPEHMMAAVRRETPGELIRWTGRPDASSAFRWSMLIYLFAVPWMAFTLFFTVGMVGVGVGGKAPWPPGWGTTGLVVGLLFMVPFLAVGLAMLAAPFWLWRRARAMVYVVTDKRLLRAEVYSGRTKVKTIWPDRIVSMERTESADGSGSLNLLLGQRRDSEGDMVTETEAIAGVPEVRKLEELLADFRPQPVRLPGS